MDGNELVGRLKAWYAAIEAEDLEYAEAVESEDVTLGIEDHGVVSSRFVCRFASGRVRFDGEILLDGIYGDAEDHAAARDNELATLEMAITLLSADAKGFAWLKNDPAATVDVMARERSCGYRISDGSDTMVEAGSDWRGLIARLDTVGIAGAPDGMIIRP